jgi:hypothetical protein
MKQDKFLIGILVGIGVLVVLAVTLFLTRQTQQTYVNDDSPKGVVQNYVVALYKKDYEKAFGYLAAKENKPTLDEFRQSFINQKLEISQTGVTIGEQEITGSDATVAIVIIRGGGGPFNDVFRDSQTAILKLQSGTWKITNFPYPYWGYNWFLQPVKPTLLPGS